MRITAVTGLKSGRKRFAGLWPLFLSIRKGSAMNLRINAIAFALISAVSLPGYAQVTTPPSAQVERADAASPHKQFQASLKALAEKDYERAAAEIHRGEAVVEQAAARAAGDARAALEASAAELKTLAAEVGSGAVHEKRSLESAFARAEHALAHGRAQVQSASPFDYGA
jgi:hypothetical protein